MSQNRNGVTNALDLALQAMQAANVLTPAVAGIIAIVKKGREDGKDDEAIKAESLRFAQETDAEADRQLAIKPTS